MWKLALAHACGIGAAHRRATAQEHVLAAHPYFDERVEVDSREDLQQALVAADLLARRVRVQHILAQRARRHIGILLKAQRKEEN